MTRRLVLPLIFLFLLGASGSAVRADHDHDPHDRIADRSADLADHSRDLYYEIRAHYRGEPFAAHLMSDTLNVYRSARRITGYAQAHARFSIMEREVQRLEDAFQHLEETLRGTARHHGSHRHIRELERCIDKLVHEIHDDVHDLRRDDVGYGGYGRSVGFGSDGVTFGSGGFTVRLGR